MGMTSVVWEMIGALCYCQKVVMFIEIYCSSSLQIFSKLYDTIRQWFAQFRGQHFEGTLHLNKISLTVGVLEYRKKKLYGTRVTNANINSCLGTVPVFRTIQDLFEQLVSNKELEITDENKLILPIRATYRGQDFPLNIELQLSQKQIISEKEIKQYEEKLAQSKLHTKKQKPDNIFFSCIGRNISYRRQSHFKSNTLFAVKKYSNKRELTLLNNSWCLESEGVFDFEVRILESLKLNISLGICGEQVIDHIDRQIFKYPRKFMGFSLKDGHLYANMKRELMAPNLKEVEGSVIKVEIDMSNKEIAWYMNNELLYSTDIAADLVDEHIYPMITLFDEEDFVDLNNIGW